MIGWSRDADGVVTLTMDDPDQRANIMNLAFRQSLGPVVDRLYAEQDSITGVILTSAKDTFFAGGDLRLLSQVTDETAAEFFAAAEQLKAQPAPVGDLLPAGGRGAERLRAGRRAGDRAGLPSPHRAATAEGRVRLSRGHPGPAARRRRRGPDGPDARHRRRPDQAAAHRPAAWPGRRGRGRHRRRAGRPPEELLAAARRWIAANPQPSQPWDRPGYRIPGGTPANPSFAAMLPALPATLRKRLKGAPMPAPHHILAAAVEGSQVDVDTALRIETRYLTDLVRGQVAKNMISAFWFDLNAINSGGSRPAGYPPRLASRVAVLGAGMMGAGIAYVAARNGIEVVLRDVTTGGRREGQGLLPQPAGQGRQQWPADRGRARAGAGPDHPDRLGGRPRRLRPGGRGGLRECRAQAAGVRRGRAGGGTGRAVRLEHLDAADQHAGRGGAAQARTLSACTSSHPSTSCRCWRSSVASGPRMPRWPAPWTSPGRSTRPRSWSTTAGAFSPAG